MGILQGTIPNDWQGEYCRYAVCWPNSPMWLAVLRGVLTLPARGRFWDEHTGIIIEAQAVIRETFDYNLHLKEVIMACDDQGLQEIAAALRLIANNQCCGNGPIGGQGSGGAGPTEEELLEIIEGNPEVDPPPEGFETWEEYQAYKCAIAHDILNILQADLLRIGSINLGVMSTETLSIALTIALTASIPPVAIVGIAILLVGIVGEIIVVSLLSYINDHKEELICGLYSGNSPQQSLDMFHSILGGHVDDSTVEPIENYGIKTLARYMVNNNVVNRLYQKDLTRTFATDLDCSGCGVGGLWVTRTDADYVEIATLNVPNDWFTMSSHSSGPFWSLYMQVNEPLIGVKAEFQNLVGWTATGVDPTPFEVMSADHINWLYEGTDFLDFAAAAASIFLDKPPTTEIRQWGIVSSTAFTVEVRFTLQ